MLSYMVLTLILHSINSHVVLTLILRTLNSYHIRIVRSLNSYHIRVLHSLNYYLIRILQSLTRKLMLYFQLACIGSKNGNISIVDVRSNTLIYSADNLDKNREVYHKYGS